jgi:hypothetical protein
MHFSAHKYIGAIMKGKITKDILLRVGKGVMRIPRSINDDANSQEPQRFSPTPADGKKNTSRDKTNQS